MVMVVSYATNAPTFSGGGVGTEWPVPTDVAVVVGDAPVLAQKLALALAASISNSQYPTKSNKANKT